MRLFVAADVSDDVRAEMRRVREALSLAFAAARVRPRLVLASTPLRPTTARVDHVTLYRSHLSSKGPTYVALSRTMLE